MPSVSDIFLLFPFMYFSYLLGSVAFMTFESSFTIYTGPEVFSHTYLFLNHPLIIIL
jgi:hypothetical protein